MLVARDPLNRGAAFINPLELGTDEEKALFQQGEEHKKRLLSRNVNKKN